MRGHRLLASSTLTACKLTLTLRFHRVSIDAAGNRNEVSDELPKGKRIRRSPIEWVVNWLSSSAFGIGTLTPQKLPQRRLVLVS